MIHRRDDERESGGKAAPQKRVRSYGARGVHLEGIYEVVESGLEDRVEAAPGQVEPENGDDPVDGRIGRPAGDELAGREEHGPEHHGREPPLGDGAVARGVVALVVVELVAHVDEAAGEGADAEREEGQLARHQRPAPDLAEDDGHRPQLHVEDAVAEACVQRDERADGRAEQLDRADQELPPELQDADVPLLELGVQRPVARLEPQPPRLGD